MSQAYLVRHDSYSSSPGYPTPFPAPPPSPPPTAAPPLGYPRPPDRLPSPPLVPGYQGYFHRGYHPPSATPPPLRPYHLYHDNYGVGCSSLLKGCLAALCCCCILGECCF